MSEKLDEILTLFLFGTFHGNRIILKRQKYPYVEIKIKHNKSLIVFQFPYVFYMLMKYYIDDKYYI